MKLSLVETVSAIKKGVLSKLFEMCKGLNKEIPDNQIIAIAMISTAVGLLKKDPTTAAKTAIAFLPDIVTKEKAIELVDDIYSKASNRDRLTN